MIFASVIATLKMLIKITLFVNRHHWIKWFARIRKRR